MAEENEVSIDVVIKEEIAPTLASITKSLAALGEAVAALSRGGAAASEAIVATAVTTEKLGESAEIASASIAKNAEVLAATAVSTKAAGDGSAKLAGDLGKVDVAENKLIPSTTKLKTELKSTKVATEDLSAGLNSGVGRIKNFTNAIKDVRQSLNETVGSFLSFRNLAVGALATLGLFKAKNFFESVITDAARLDATIRRAAAASGALDLGVTERVRESLKRVAVSEGESLGKLAEAAVGIIPDVGEKSLEGFLRVAQQFSSVAGGEIGQIADTLIFIIKGFGLEATQATGGIEGLAASISDKLFVAAREGNIAIGQLTGVIGLAAQQAEVLGLSFDELLAAFTALGDVGVKPSRAFRVLSGVLNSVQDPSEKLKEAIAGINTALPDLDLNFSKTGLAADGLGLFISKLSRAVGADEKLAKELGLSTRELGLIFKIAGENGKSYYEALGKIQGSYGEVGKASQFILEGTQGQIEKISSLFSALKDDIAQIFIPAIDEFLNSIRIGLSVFRNDFGQTASLIRQAAGVVAISVELDDTQKKQAIEDLKKQQGFLEEKTSGYIYELLITVFKKGAIIFGDIIFVAFSKAGVLLVDLLGTVFAKAITAITGITIKTDAESLSDLKAIRSSSQAVTNKSNVIPANIPTKSVSEDLVVRIANVLTLATARVAGGDQNEILVSLSKLLGANESLGVLASQDKDRFIAIVEQVLQLERSNSISFSKLGNTPKVNPASQAAMSGMGGGSGTLGGGSVPPIQKPLDDLAILRLVVARRDSEQALPSDQNEKLNVLLANSIDDLRLAIRESFAKTLDRNQPEAAVKATAATVQGGVSGEIPEGRLAGANVLAKQLPADITTFKQLDERISTLESTVADAKAAQSEIIDATQDRIIGNIKDLTTGFAEIAKNASDPAKAIEELGANVEGFEGLIAAQIGLRNQTEKTREVLAKLGEQYGFTVKELKNGAIEIVSTQQAIKQNEQDLAENAKEIQREAEKGILTTNGLLNNVDKTSAQAQRSVSALKEQLIQMTKVAIESKIAENKATPTQENTRQSAELQSLASSIDARQKQITLIQVQGDAVVDGLGKVLALRKEIEESISKAIPIDGIKEVQDSYRQISDVLNELDGLSATIKARKPTEQVDINASNVALGDIDARVKAILEKALNDGIAAKLDNKSLLELVRKQLLDVSKAQIALIKELAVQRAKALKEVEKDIGGSIKVGKIATDIDALLTEVENALVNGNEKAADEAKQQIVELAKGIEDGGLELSKSLENIYTVISKINGAVLGGFNSRTLSDNALALLRAFQDDLKTEQTKLLKEKLEYEAIVQGVADSVSVNQNKSNLFSKVAETKSRVLSKGDPETQASGERIAAANAALNESIALQTELNNLESFVGKDERLLQIQEEVALRRELLSLALEAGGDRTFQGEGFDELTTNQLIEARIGLLQKENFLKAQGADLQRQLSDIGREFADLQIKNSKSQETAAQTTASAFIKVKAVYGEAIFAIDGSYDSTERAASVTRQYITALEDLKAKLETLRTTNPEQQAEIQPQLDAVNAELVEQEVVFSDTGRSVGEKFQEGFKQGLGSSQDLEAFAENLSRGIGGAFENNLSTAIDGVVDGTMTLQEAFASFVSSTLIDIGKLIIKMLILQGIQMAVGGFSGGGLVEAPQPRKRVQALNAGGEVLQPSKERIVTVEKAIQPPKVQALNTGGEVAEPPKVQVVTVEKAIEPPKVQTFNTGGEVIEPPKVQVVSVEKVIESPKVQALNTGGEVVQPPDVQIVTLEKEIQLPPKVQALNTGGKVIEPLKAENITVENVIESPKVQALNTGGEVQVPQQIKLVEVPQPTIQVQALKTGGEAKELTPKIRESKPIQPVEEPQLKIRESKPIQSVQEIKPTVEMSQPIQSVEEPKLTVEKPKLMVEEPKLMVEELKPTVEKPKSMVEELKPTVQKPKLMVEELQAVVEKPKPIKRAQTLNTGGEVQELKPIQSLSEKIGALKNYLRAQAFNTGGEVSPNQKYESFASKISAISNYLIPLPQKPLLALNNGGAVSYLAGGGFPNNAPRVTGKVPGAANERRDVVPAMLTPGEFVIRKTAVQQYGMGVLTALNQKMLPTKMFDPLMGARKFAEGGSVEIPPMSSMSNSSTVEQQKPQQPSPPVQAYIVASEQAMSNLLSGGKNSMVDFIRRNKANGG